MNEDRLVDEFTRRLARPGERIWKDGEALLTNPLLRTLAVGLGIDLTAIDSQHRDVREAAEASVQAAILFSRFGWTVTARAPHRHAYVEAVHVWNETGDAQAVDECLTRWWNDGKAYLRGTFGPMLQLAGRHRPTLERLLERNQLLMKALAHHEGAEYEASVLIVLSQIDGLVLDLTDPSYGFFYKGKDRDFEDDATVAGMPDVLRVVHRAVNRVVNETSISDAFERSPIIHGRHLRFGTQTNSTKAFALLAGVIEWLGPKARELTDRLQDEHEARYAGSDELDPDGRRLDARGFRETRDSLRWLAIRQASEYRSLGRYRDDLPAMFPVSELGFMKRRDAIRLALGDDATSYWAWAKTDSEFCFGIAATAGETTSSYYADLGPPGPPGVDPRWVGEFDRTLPDWSGD